MPSILIVDDEEDLRVLIRFELEVAGYDVREAASGAEAIAALAEERPDCVMLDVRMPDQTGFELLDELRDRGELDGLRIVMLSGHNDPEHIAKGTSRGVTSFVTKPFQFDEVLSAIAAALESAPIGQDGSTAAAP